MPPTTKGDSSQKLRPNGKGNTLDNDQLISEIQSIFYIYSSINIPSDYLSVPLTLISANPNIKGFFDTKDTTSRNDNEFKIFLAQNLEELFTMGGEYATIQSAKNEEKTIFLSCAAITLAFAMLKYNRFKVEVFEDLFLKVLEPLDENTKNGYSTFITTNEYKETKKELLKKETAIPDPLDSFNKYPFTQINKLALYYIIVHQKVIFAMSLTNGKDIKKRDLFGVLIQEELFNSKMSAIQNIDSSITLNFQLKLVVHLNKYIVVNPTQLRNAEEIEAVQKANLWNFFFPIENPIKYSGMMSHSLLDTLSEQPKINGKVKFNGKPLDNAVGKLKKNTTVLTRISDNTKAEIQGNLAEINKHYPSDQIDKLNSQAQDKFTVFKDYLSQTKKIVDITKEITPDISTMLTGIPFLGTVIAWGKFALAVGSTIGDEITLRAETKTHEGMVKACETINNKMVASYMVNDIQKLEYILNIRQNSFATEYKLAPTSVALISDYKLRCLKMNIGDMAKKLGAAATTLSPVPNIITAAAVASGEAAWKFYQIYRAWYVKQKFIEWETNSTPLTGQNLIMAQQELWELCTEFPQLIIIVMQDLTKNCEGIEFVQKEVSRGPNVDVNVTLKSTMADALSNISEGVEKTLNLQEKAKSWWLTLWGNISFDRLNGNDVQELYNRLAGRLQDSDNYLIMIEPE